jgi:rfaE bifunctional protein kinase chain/domain
MRGLHPDSQTALREILAVRKAGARITFVSGNFNIVHPGHLRLLRFAAECGDYLVVGVHADGHEGVMLAEDLRLAGVKANSWVQYAFILHDQPADFIRVLRPAVVVKGKEHERMDNPELHALQGYGGKLLFSSGDISFSSIDLLRDEFRHLNYSTIRQPEKYLQRHGIDTAAAADTLKKIGALKTLVLGDLIIDEYITCDALGMSQEDPTIVVTPVMQERFIGGAGIVSAHARALGAEVIYVGVCGTDATAEFAVRELEKAGVKNTLLTDEARPTTLKQRYRANSKTLLRVNHLRQNPISRDLQERIMHRVTAVIDDLDLVIFSDFNYGCLPDEMVSRLIDEFRAREIMMVADSQSSSQVGDVSRFHSMKLLTPTEREARLALQNFTDGLVVLGELLRQKARAENVFITLGAEGTLTHAGADNASGFATDRLPALNNAPRDVAGAGDALLTCASLALAAGADIWTSAYIGSMAAACQVGKVGNIPLTVEELRREILQARPFAS